MGVEDATERLWLLGVTERIARYKSVWPDGSDRGPLSSPHGRWRTGHFTTTDGKEGHGTDFILMKKARRSLLGYFGILSAETKRHAEFA